MTKESFFSIFINFLCSHYIVDGHKLSDLTHSLWTKGILMRVFCVCLPLIKCQLNITVFLSPLSHLLFNVPRELHINKLRFRRKKFIICYLKSFRFYKIIIILSFIDSLDQPCRNILWSKCNIRLKSIKLHLRVHASIHDEKDETSLSQIFRIYFQRVKIKINFDFSILNKQHS